MYFNDKRKRKVLKLEEHIMQIYPDDRFFKISFSSEGFESAFQRSIPIMTNRNSANFLFLDQNGIKHITKEIFQIIINIRTTDFLFFISSSTLKRFNDNSDIKKYISIPDSVLSTSDYYHIHRRVLDYYRTLIPKTKEFYLCPFSIKKGSNVYGLIFGTGHLLGIEKFVNQCWKIDPQTGDSNFDIDNDKINQQQMTLFPDIDKPKKIQGFENELENAIMSQKLSTNIEIYKFCLFNGFKAEQVRKVVSKLIKEKKLPQQRLNISYNSCKPGKAPQQVIFK